MIIGDATIWSDTFPADLIPRMLNLVVETWHPFRKPVTTDHEVPITRRFKHALKQAKDFRRLPVRIEREPAEDDPVTGEELGRIDLKFLPAVSALEEIYFAFECKRLNATIGGYRRTLATEYVTEGVMRFVTGQYSSAVDSGGMIGYILDGEIDGAIGAVGQNIASRRAELRMSASASLEGSGLHPDNPLIQQTDHTLSAQRQFRIHHIFLPCC